MSDSISTPAPSAAPSANDASGILSIAICTHNRAKDTLECVDRLLPQLAMTKAELVVVDSASNPQESAVLREGLLVRPPARLLRLEKAGLSEARNLAISETSGEWIAYLDDDAVPASDWLTNILETLKVAPDNCGAIGGQLLPVYPPGSVPAIGRRWKMYLSLNETSGERDCTERFELIGANSCFRRKALDQIGSFPLDLGRYGGNLLSGEDVWVMWRLKKAGWRMRYDSRFSAGHKIPRERLVFDWVKSRAYWEGVTTVRMNRLLQQPGKMRLIGKALLAAPVLLLASLVDTPQNEWKLRLWFDLGVIVEGFGFGPK
ncbi:glycosyltransferase family A protein [soil metagenome]